MRPWFTTVIDDHSRAVTGYMVFLGAPSALNTLLALQQAIWRKTDAAWAVCGIPDVLYVDHGSDFTRVHLEQVVADLRIPLIHSAVVRPQGRGKVERLFCTIITELLPELPGHVVGGRLASTPRLSLADLDYAIGAFVVCTYNLRPHSRTGEAPRETWAAGAFLPRVPDSLEEVDLLLVQHAKPRIVQRDSIRFEDLRYASPTLAGFVGEAVTLKDIEAARRAHRLALRAGIGERIARVADFLLISGGPAQTAAPRDPPSRARTRLRLYEEDY
ncbi:MULTISPECIES: Mu transposase C-terminal domain-containing protein [Paracoccus]|uniref:Mu transposase C-terminal domain-containing protein n=1 Tax=Paracoccus TaxID=265 RepID=UPI000868CF89|nr:MULTISPECIES: Mu transposase C-terminal domain-containing protein [Paracoccus]ODT57677.1 MAG: hypothetical protein ABS73_15925 [Paracoccus sp. SCN 68-21]